MRRRQDCGRKARTEEGVAARAGGARQDTHTIQGVV